MQAFTGEILTDPYYGLAAATLVAGGLIACASFVFEKRRQSGDPLKKLFNASTFESEFESIAERAARIRPRSIAASANLHGQRAQYARLCEVWEHDTREEAIEQIARVMRASMDTAPAPLEIVNADPVFDAIEWEAQCEAEWEEIKLLPPPVPSPASHAA